jgi:septal ring factor EnvC (AmiA/AmiB activator)
LLALTAMPSLAEPDRAERLKEVEQRIEQAEKEAESIAARAEGVLGEMDRLDRSINGRERKVRDLAAEARAAQLRKDEAERRIAALDADLPRLRSRFEARARGLYYLTRRGLASVVLRAPRDWSETVRYRRSLEAMLAHDREIVSELRRNRADADAARQRAEIEGSTLSARRQESERELASLRAERGEKQALLASLREEKEKRARLLEELKASAEKLHELIAAEEASSATPFQAPSGTERARLRFPLLGSAASIAAARNGIEIRAAARTPILAVTTGRVVFAGWFTGYGNMIILDHGDHLYSVYGYANELRVEAGRVVASGDEIATVGATGPVSVPSLYFEIRDHGVPRDPAAYVPTLARQ